MKNWFPVGVSLLRQILWLLAVVLLALRSAAFYQVIVARLLCGVVEAAASLLLSYRPGALSGPRRFDWKEAAQLVRFGFPMVVGAIAQSIYFRIDQVMLNKMAGAAVLGPYVIAVQLTEQFGVLPVALVGSLAPVLAVSAWDEDRFSNYIETASRFLMVVSFLACVLIIPITAPVVALLYGAEFLPTSHLINILIWSEAPLFLAVVIIHALLARNLQKYLAAGSLCGAFLNVALNLLFIPRWGAAGSAWATLISYTVGTVLIYLFLETTRKIAWSAFRQAAIPFALAIAIIWLFRLWEAHFLLKFGMGALAYGAGILAAGVIRKSDLTRARAILGKSFRVGVTS